MHGMPRQACLVWSVILCLVPIPRYSFQPAGKQGWEHRLHSAALADKEAKLSGIRSIGAGETLIHVIRMISYPRRASIYTHGSRER